MERHCQTKFKEGGSIVPSMHWLFLKADIAMTDNYTKLQLIKMLRSADITRIKNMHFTLRAANWIHQDSLRRTLGAAVRSSFPDIGYLDHERLLVTFNS